MQEVLLADGMGRRLGTLTKHNTKCMIKVNDVTLIDRTLKSLLPFSLERVVIVVGYGGDNLKKYIGNRYDELNIEYVENEIYETTNNIYSLYLAKDYLLLDDTLLLESDVIFDPLIIKKMILDPYPNLVAVASYENWMDGTVVDIDENKKILNFISKDSFSYNEIHNYYKTVNIYKFSKDFIQKYYVPFLQAYSTAFGKNAYYEEVLKVITAIHKTELKAFVLENENWYEIDDVQDLDIAETIFSSENERLLLLQKRYGGYWRFPKLVDFCYLVNPYFPPQKMIDEIKSNFISLLTEYPSGQTVNNMLAAKCFSIKSEYVCVGNGAAELIKCLMESLSGVIGIIKPTFEEYPNRKKSEDLLVYTPSNRDFSYTYRDIINYFDDKNIQNLILINPDNPSGNFIQIIDLLEILSWAQEKNIFVVVDESFVDFSEGGTSNSLLKNDILEQFSNLIVVKSISKSFGVPGLRLGVVASSNQLFLSQIKQSISIWNINSFAEFYLQIYSKYENEYKRGCISFVDERKRFFNKLKSINYLRVLPSQANYFLCEVLNKFTSTSLANILLLKYNILIKDCASKSSFHSSNYIRIAVRNREDNDLIIKCLKELL